MGYDKSTPWQSRTIKKSYDDCTAELMLGISIPYIVFSIKWKRECLNTALNQRWDPIGTFLSVTMVFNPVYKENETAKDVLPLFPYAAFVHVP